MQAICERYGVHSVPVFLYFNDASGNHGASYAGDREFESLNHFVKTTLGASNTQQSVSNAQVLFCWVYEWSQQLLWLISALLAAFCAHPNTLLCQATCSALKEGLCNEAQKSACIKYALCAILTVPRLWSSLRVAWAPCVCHSCDAARARVNKQTAQARNYKNGTGYRGKQ